MYETVFGMVLLGAFGVSLAWLVLYALAELWFWMDERERGDK